MNLRSTIQHHINEPGCDNVVILLVAYDDDLLLAARVAIQKIAPVKVELLSFPLYYNEQDTEKLVKQISEAKPTLIINAAEHKWLAENVNAVGADTEAINASQHDLRVLAHGRFDLHL